jgi:hypothetical protein
LNGPHEFDKHEPVPKENRHEEIGERAMAALNSTTDKSVTGDSGCGFVIYCLSHLWAVVAVEFQHGCQANGTYRGRMQWIEVSDVEFNIA